MTKKEQRKRIHPPYYKFMGYMKENAIRNQDLSTLLSGQSIQTISAKNNGWSDYSMTEIDKICTRFGISSEIFRVKKVS